MHFSNPSNLTEIPREEKKIMNLSGKLAITWNQIRNIHPVNTKVIQDQIFLLIEHIIY